MAQKIIPVLVSMGVAAGTFSGLYFGLGTKADDAVAEEVKIESGSGSAAAPDPAGGSGTETGSGSGSVAETGSGSGSETGSGTETGSGSGSVAAGSGTETGSGSGSAVATTVTSGSGSGAGSAQKAVVPVTVQFSVVPPTAEVSIDGVLVEGGVAQVELGSNGKKVVKIIAKASGYRTYEKKVTIKGDQVVTVKMSKRGGSSSSSGTGPGDKIDLGKIDM